MMTMTTQRAHHVGHGIFHFHPEAQVGTGAVPDGESPMDGELHRTTIPDSTTGTTTPTVSSATPDPETESTTTTH